MISKLKNNQRYEVTLFLSLLTILCFALSLFRVIYSETNVFLFLNWNLFLAFIPWLFTSIAMLYPRIRKSDFLLILIVGSWLLFFPNAPYILTDLFHLRLKSSMPVWFDLVLILSYAWTGLMFGFMSLWDIEILIFEKISRKIRLIFPLGLLFLGSFGIYVGRYLRWNSWDIIKEPFGLFYDISDRLVNPFDHPRTWGMTIFMWLFLSMLYFSFRIVKKYKTLG